jgi:hypothetical protein
MSVLREPPAAPRTDPPRRPPGRFGGPGTWLAANARQPVAAWLAAHLVLTAVMLGLVRHAGMRPLKALHRWDGTWYLDIARHGYITRLSLRPNGSPRLMNAAFFPAYPYLARAVHGVTFLPLLYAALAVTLISGMAAAVGIHVLLRPWIGSRASILAAALWGVVPAAFVESMVYTESLFTAACVWLMYALIREKWLTAAALAILAGLTRSTALAVVPVVCLAALLAIARGRGGPRAWICLAAAPLGILGFLGFLALRLHRPDAWFYVQSAPGWKSGFDFGHSTAHILATLVTFRGVRWKSWMPYLLATACLIPSVLLTAEMVARRRLPWQLIAWTVLTLATTLLTSGTYGAKPRFMLPCVALLAAPAAVLDRRSRPTRAAVLLGLALVGGWVGAYFLKFTDFPP